MSESNPHESDFSYESIFSNRIGFLPKGYKKSDILEILNTEKIENMLIIKYKEILEKTRPTEPQQEESEPVVEEVLGQNSVNKTIDIINKYIELLKNNNDEKKLNNLRNLILEKMIIDFYDNELPYLYSVKRIKQDFIFIYEHILKIAKDVELNLLTDVELNKMINPIERFYNKIIDYAKKQKKDLFDNESDVVLSNTIYNLPYNIEAVKNRRNILIEIENKPKGILTRGQHSTKDVLINNEKKVGLEAKNQSGVNLKKIKKYILCVASILREMRNYNDISLTIRLFEILKILKEKYERTKHDQEQELYTTADTIKIKPKTGGKKTKYKRRKKNKNKTKRRKNKRKIKKKKSK